MFRALSILAAVAALAVSAAPVASAGLVKAMPKAPSGTNWIDNVTPDLMLKAKPKAPAQKGARYGTSSGSVGFKRSGAAKAPRPAGDVHSLFGSDYADSIFG